MKKKMFIYSFVSIAFILSWVIFSINQPPEWKGASESGLWTTTFEDEYSPKGFWSGFFIWNGEEPLTVTAVSLTRNGKEIHGWEQEVVMKKKSSYNYLVTTETFDNRDDEYILMIHWNDNEGHQQEKIKLYPKTRYFVLPTFY